MLIKCTRRDLFNALQIVQRGVATQSTLPILSGVSLRAMKPEKSKEKGEILLHSTDLEISVSTRMDAVVKKEGAVVLPAKLLFDIVRNLPEGGIEFSSEEETQSLNLKSGSSVYYLQVLPVSDFPSFPGDLEEGVTELERKGLLESLKQITKAVSRDETRPALTGAQFTAKGKTARFVATDSYRLALKEVKLQAPSKREIEAIVPLKALEELQKALAVMAEEKARVQVGGSSSQISFVLPPTTFVSRLIDGQFPKYEQLLPASYQVILEASREEMAGAITRAALLAQKNLSVKINIDIKGMSILAGTQGLGEASERVEIKNLKKSTLEVAFNAQYLLDGLSSITQERVLFELTDAASPGLLRGSSPDGFSYLIMPIRLQ